MKANPIGKFEMSLSFFSRLSKYQVDYPWISDCGREDKRNVEKTIPPVVKTTLRSRVYHAVPW